MDKVKVRQIYSVKTEEEIIQEILQTLEEYQKIQNIVESTAKKFIFNWGNATKEYVDYIEESNICDWLQPIKFDVILAIIIEAIQSNIDSVLNNRNRGLKIIQQALKIEKKKFYDSIKSIQKILIDFEKVKVCKDGTVVIINEI